MPPRRSNVSLLCPKERCTNLAGVKIPPGYGRWPASSLLSEARRLLVASVHEVGLWPFAFFLSSATCRANSST